MRWRAVRWRILALGAVALMASVPLSTPAAPIPAPTPAAARSGDAYPIRLDRPMRAGDTFAFTADATVIQTMTADLSGQTRTLQPRSISVHFDGTERVLAVNPRGVPTRAEYKVTECTAREGKQQVAIVQPGRTVTVEAGKWKSTIMLDEGGLTIQNELVLQAVLSLPNLTHAGDDNFFGTDKPQRVGDAWQPRADALVKLAAAAGVKLKPQNVSGSVKLAGVETVDGVPCLKVQGKVKVEHFLPPATDLPPGSRAEDTTFELKFTRLLSTDPAGPCMNESHSTNLLMKMRTDDPSIGSDIVVDGKLLRTVGVKRRPVKG